MEILIINDKKYILFTIFYHTSLATRYSMLDKTAENLSWGQRALLQSDQSADGCGPVTNP